MICYRGITFCPYWFACKDGPDCERALTEYVEKSAAYDCLPIARYAEPPDCFKEF